MTPQELKNSILQLAIQGKLVEQRPEEETAEELYKQIQAEKQKLIAEGKIKKQKELPNISEDEIPFDIPDSWKWCYMGEIFDHVSGKALNAKNTDGLLHKYITTSNVYWDHFELDNLKEMYYTDDEIKKYSVRQNDLLVLEGGDVGRTAIWDRPESYCIQNHIHRLRPYVCVSIRFYYYVMMLLKNIGSITGKGIGIKGLSSGTLHKIVVPLPPLEEQKRIVAKIEEILPYIDKYEEAWTKLEEFNKKFPDDMQKSILQLAIQGKLVEQLPEEETAEELYQQIQAEKQKLIEEGQLRKTKKLPNILAEDIPFDFPKTWKVCYIDDIAFVTKLAGFEYSKNIAPNLSVTGIPLFKGKNVQDSRIVHEFESYIPESVSDELPRSQIRRKSLLTPYVGTIGNIAIFDGSYRAHLGSNVGKIELLNNTELHILEEYVLYYLKSSIGYAELTKYKKATAQESISIDAIRNAIIALPPLEEQKRIVAKIEEILPLCEKLR